jgi:hypothetical protein
VFYLPINASITTYVTGEKIYGEEDAIPFTFLRVGSETNAHDFSCTQVYFNQQEWFKDF